VVNLRRGSVQLANYRLFTSAVLQILDAYARNILELPQPDAVKATRLGSKLISA
jgi:hypothetical protein